MEYKKVLILGFAKSGYEAAKVLIKRDCEVIINDNKTLDNIDKEKYEELNSLGVSFVLGSHPDDLLNETFTHLIKNPGVPIDHKYVLKAKELNIDVINEVELAYSLIPKEKNIKIIGITGTNGKTTTTTLIYEMLKKDNIPCLLAGNIGYPLCSVLDKLKENDIPVILVLNKIDKIPYEQLLPKINEYKDLFPFKEIVPLSAMKEKNVDELIKAISNYLTDDIKYYDDETITNISTSFSISELVREKVLYFTSKEVPHAVTCIVDDISEDKYNISVLASIIVDRENLKKILIGKNGSMIKKIGTEARKDIERLLNKKVYLDLKVKVVEKWRDKDQFLNQTLGYKDFNN